MEVNLTDDQRHLSAKPSRAGGYNGEEDALREALSLWEGPGTTPR